MRNLKISGLNISRLSVGNGLMSLFDPASFRACSKCDSWPLGRGASSSLSRAMVRIFNSRVSTSPSVRLYTVAELFSARCSRAASVSKADAESLGEPGGERRSNGRLTIIVEGTQPGSQAFKLLFRLFYEGGELGDAFGSVLRVPSVDTL